MQVNYRPLSVVQRTLLIALGTTTLALGIAGMFLPGVPTTVFLLITIGCYTRSSERMYRWVLTRPWLQKPLQTAFAFKERGALPVRVKLLAQGVAWSSVVLTVFGGTRPVFQIITLVFAASCTIAMAIIKSEGGDAPPRAWRSTPGDIARQLAYGAVAGAAAGAIGGLAGLTVLRFVANLAGAGIPAIADLQHGLATIATAIALGALGGLAYAGLRRILPRDKWLNSALFGALAMLAAASALVLTASAPGALAALGSPWREIALLLFVPVFGAYGVITCLTFRRLEREPLRQPAQS